MRPESCACTGRKRDAHALQHCFGIRSTNELTVVGQSLASSGGALQLVCLARSTGTIAHSGGTLETNCLFLNHIFRHGRRFSNSGVSRLTSTPATGSTSHTTADVVANIQRSAEKFRRHMISFRDQVVALLRERNDSNCIGLDLDL